MENFHQAVRRRVVSVSVQPDIKHDAIVVISEPDFTYLIADDRFLLPGQNQIVAEFPNRDISASIFFRGNNGIVGILCAHPGQQPDLEEIEFYGGNIDIYDRVYTYSRHSVYQALTPGGVTSLFNGGFNHDCSAHHVTHCGSPVIVSRDDGARVYLVGMCFNFWHSVSAYNVDTICARIMENHFQEYNGIHNTLQFLRSLCA